MTCLFSTTNRGLNFFIKITFKMFLRSLFVFLPHFFLLLMYEKKVRWHSCWLGQRETYILKTQLSRRFLLLYYGSRHSDSIFFIFAILTVIQICCFIVRDPINCKLNYTQQCKKNEMKWIEEGREWSEAPF